jgi:type I restriction enzyme S subunit
MREVLLTALCRPKQWKTISTRDLKSKGYPVYGANGKIGFYDIYTHENPTLLITCRGATCGTINISEPKSYVNGNAMALDNLSQDVDLYFLKHYLEYRKLDDVISGSAQPQITGQGLANIKIPLPPLETQQKIASILDNADTYRQKTKALIAKYDELTQSLFLDMFGDPVKNEKGWEVKKLGHITNMKAGKFIAASEIYSENSSKLQPCFGGNGLRGYVKSHTHEGEFVLIGRQGALCGNVKITNGKFHATEHAIVCSPEVQYSTLWLYYLLKLMNLNRFSTGAAQPGLNVGTLVDLEVFFVPLNLQNQFAERVEAIEIQKAQAQVSLEKAEELFNSLLQRAFNGELV